VTGGSRGIGASIARAFAERGDRVAVHYGSAKTTAEAVRDSLPGDGHVIVAADMADADAVRDMVDAAADALGGLDVLVNNAGIYTSHPVLETGYAEWQAAWRDTLGVNLIGAANATWCAVRHMTGRGGPPGGGPGPVARGRIVNVGSRGAYRGEPANPAYGASKAGLHAFGQSLAVALAPHGITVASVAPGFVQTDMAREILAGPAGDGIRAQSPFNRVATPDEIAAAVVFLASPGATWASGAVLDLNGASYLRLRQHSAGAVLGEHPPGDRAVPDLGAAPQREPLPRLEEHLRLVVRERDGDDVPVAGVQRRLPVVPAQFRGEARPFARLGLEHQRTRVVEVLVALVQAGRGRRERSGPGLRDGARIGERQHAVMPVPVPLPRECRSRPCGVKRDHRPVPDLPHIHHLP
jgi:NAD(P)-dependent dehydrogenase (short-subunit alcohol dehydrogenase family)